VWICKVANGQLPATGFDIPIVSLLLRTNIRMGNMLNKELYGSFGFTTLKNLHLVVKGIELRFVLKGKEVYIITVPLKVKFYPGL